MSRHDEDAATIEAVVQGDREAFAGLVERHKDRVYAVLLRLTSDPGVAEELAHDAFVRAYLGLSGFRGEARFGTWVIQIAIHLVRDRVRQDRRRSSIVSLDEIEERGKEAGVPAGARSGSDPLAATYDGELAQRLEEALAALPASYREVFVLHHVHEIPYEEIATMTGDTVGSLKVRAHRARKLLKESLFLEDDRPGRRETGE